MGQLHIVFFPYLAHGHMIPMLDMAKVFSSCGVKTTIISTPGFAEPVKRAQESGIDVGLSTIKFPPEGSDLPDNFVSLDQFMDKEDLFPKFLKAVTLLQEPVEKLLGEFRPNCLVSDMFLPWTNDSAAKFGIPRLIFHGTNYLSRCGLEEMRRHKPYKNVSSSTEPFILPNLPHQLKFTRTQVDPYELDESDDDVSNLMKQVRESEEKSYGTVINSFYELEPEYADHYKKVLVRRAWHIGPLLLYNNGNIDKAQRGKNSSIDEHECLAWLDSKKPNSVVYMCFGSMTSFTSAQLHEKAVGLEASNQDFIWVVRKGKEEVEDWLPKGFEERTKGKGLIITGWAPQLLILDHPSTGAFVTHCGWNSTLEAVCAGVPMVTWPVFAEQFFNEKLLTEILKIGVSVGNGQWSRKGSEGVPNKAISTAVQAVMLGEEALEMRNRAKSYQEMARQAVEQGGSSHNDLNALIEELGCKPRPIKLDSN